jgi:hypothetical protein
MKRLFILFALLPLMVAAQCNPPPQPPPVPEPVAVAGASPAPAPTDSVDAGPTPAPPDPAVTPGVRLACAKLAQLACAEGGSSCQRVLQKAIDARITLVPLDCIVGADSKPAVRACGPFIICP